MEGQDKGKGRRREDKPGASCDSSLQTLPPQVPKNLAPLVTAGYTLCHPLEPAQWSRALLVLFVKPDKRAQADTCHPLGGVGMASGRLLTRRAGRELVIQREGSMRRMSRCVSPADRKPKAQERPGQEKHHVTVAMH